MHYPIQGLTSAIFGYAIEHGWRASNPVEKVPRRRESDPHELQIYSVEQVQAIAREVQDEQTLALIVTAAMTGLRMGEILALRWRDLRWEQRSITVARAYTAGLGISSPKSRKARSVPLADQAASVLAKLGQRKDFTGPNDLVFVNENGSHLDPSIVRKRYKRALERARQREGEIPVLRFHDLRHTFGSLLASGGVDLVSIKSYMGHANMSTTMIYLHHVSAKDAAEKLTRLFEEKQIEQIEEQEEPEAA